MRKTVREKMAEFLQKIEKARDLAKGVVFSECQVCKIVTKTDDNRRCIKCKARKIKHSSRGGRW